MPLIPLTTPESKTSPAWLELGFRPFFLGAAVFSCIAMGRWMAAYVFGRALDLPVLSASQWHAHEMIYGYSLAVIAGFLLTAVRNWTQIQTPNGGRLAALACLWAAARALFLGGTARAVPAVVMDLLFTALLAVSVLSRIIRARQWRQTAIAAKLVLLLLGQIAFLLGITGRWPRGVYVGLYGGLYLVISLIQTMGARIMPGFIQNGVGGDVRVRNPRWIAIASLVFMVAFFVSEVFLARPAVTVVAAAGLFVVTTLRLAGWHVAGIWKRPLLWSLYLSFAFIDLGFLLFAIGPSFGISKFFAIHAMTVGGIGLVTLGMMSRVSLGHTGRDIRDVPPLAAVSFGAVAVCAVVRVVLPMLLPSMYVRWIGVAQVLWIAAFAVFAAAFAPMLVRPSVD